MSRFFGPHCVFAIPDRLTVGPSFARVVTRLMRLGKTVMRNTALEDVRIPLLAVRCCLRLLRLTARDPAEKELAQTLGTLLDEAHAAIRRLT